MIQSNKSLYKILVNSKEGRIVEHMKSLMRGNYKRNSKDIILEYFRRIDSLISSAANELQIKLKKIDQNW